MSKPLHVLLVEDSKVDAFLLVRNLSRSGFDVTYQQVDNPDDFRKALTEETWDLIISDFNMPQFSGLAALEMYRQFELDIPFIVVSGTIGEETAVQLVKSGAQDYIMKDNLTRLSTSIERGLEEVQLRRERRDALARLRQSEARYRAVVEDQTELINRMDLNDTLTFVNDAFARFHNMTPDQMIGQHISKFATLNGYEIIQDIHKKLTVENPVHRVELHILSPNGEYLWFLWQDRLILDANGNPSEYQGVGHDITDQKNLEAALRQREEELRNANEELHHAYDSTLEGWAKALELRDKETEGHSRSVTDMTVEMCRRFGFSEEELVHVRRGALLHDIGKMAIPDRILLKNGPLTPREWTVMKKHPQHARRMLESVEFLRLAMEIPSCHHERWDGSGYPDGLSRENIPLSARIFAVIDVYDALRSDRPYRLAWSEQRTREYIAAQSGIQFDPRVIEEFMKFLDENPPSAARSCSISRQLRPAVRRKKSGLSNPLDNPPQNHSIKRKGSSR